MAIDGRPARLADLHRGADRDGENAISGRFRGGVDVDLGLGNFFLQRLPRFSRFCAPMNYFSPLSSFPFFF